MNAPLVELCNLIADQGAGYARQHQVQFLEVVKQNTSQIISEEQATFVFKVFSFLNWTYSTGVWSSLSNTRLRRDLMNLSLMSIILRTAHELAKDKSNDGVAFLASELDSEFRKFGLLYNQRIKELSKQGFEADANSAALCGLEWIQERLAMDEDVMEIIVPQFNSRAGDIAEIEKLASQVTRAAHNRRSQVKASSRGCSTLVAIIAVIFLVFAFIW